MQPNQKDVYSFIYQKHEFIVHTKGFEDNSENDISRYVCNVLKNLKLEARDTHKLSLVKKEKIVEARLDGKVVEISSDEVNEEQIKELGLKVLNIQAPSGSVPAIVKNPPPFILQIFLRFIDWLTGAKKTASREANRFLDEVNCRNYEGLLSLVETWESLQSNKFAKENSFVNDLKQVLAGRKTISDFTKDFKEKLQNNPLMLPLGFYDEKQVFHPLILLFELKKDGWTMKLVSSDPGTPSTITYSIPDIQDIPKLLEKMITYVKDHKEDDSPVAQKRLTKILETKDVTVPDIALQEASRFEAILSHFKDFKEISRDPILGRVEGENMMMALLSQMGPKMQLEEGVKATLGLFIQHFERCASKIEKYSEKDQILILETLLKEYDQADLFCRQLLKTKKSISHIKLLAPFSERIENIRLRVKALKDRLEKTGPNDLNKDLGSVSGMSRCKVRMPSKEKLDTPPPSPVEIEPSLFQSLKEAISKNDDKIFLEKIQEISEKLNVMVDRKQYDRVIEYATQLFNLLPPPESKEGAFSLNILEEDILPMQKHLGAVVHYMWEAKVFRGDPYATFEETLGLALVHARLQLLTQLKAKYALEKIVRACFKKKEVGKILLEKDVFSEEEIRKYLTGKNSSCQLIAAVVKCCDLPFSVAVDCFSGSLNYLNEPLSAILRTDRFVVSYDPQKHEIVEKLQGYSREKLYEFFEENPDMFESAGKFYNDLVCMRKIYDKNKREISEEFNGKIPLFKESVKEPNDVINWLAWDRSRKQFFCDLDNEKSNYLTPSLKYLRAVQCQSCSIINPENTLGPNITFMDEVFNRDKKWIKQLRDRATEGSRSEQEIQAKMRHFYHQEIQSKLQKVKRLKLNSDSGIYGANLVVSGISGSEKIGFVFGEIKNFSAHRHHKSMDNVGLVSEETAHSVVSLWATSSPWFKNHSAPSYKRTLQKFIEGECHTEVYWAVKLQSQGKSGAYDLNTMNLDDDKDYHPICCENALQFILDYPAQLNNIGVRRLLETSLFRPPLLLQAMKDPTFFNARSLRLYDLIENALKTKNFDVAFYLMHVVSSINALNSEKNENLKIGYAAEYQFGDKKKSGIDVLDEQLRGINVNVSGNSVRVAIYFLEAVSLIEKSEAYSESIKKAYSILKSAPKGFDINALQQHVLEVAEKKFPALIKDVLSVEVTRYQIPFISEIAKHSDVLRVFSGKEVVGLVTEDSQKKLTYVVNGRFRVTWFKEKRTLEIQQKIKEKWYTYTEVEASAPVSLDEAILFHHAWVREKKAFVILGDQSEWENEDLLEVDLSTKGDFISIKKNDKNVGVDRQLVASKWFSCIHPSRLLFENSRKKELEKISLIGTDIVLQKSGGTWKRGEETLITDFSSLSDLSKRLLKGIGPAIHDIGLVFKNVSEKIEIFAHPIRGVKKEVETGHVCLDFKKAPISDSMPHRFVVEIKDGAVDTSCAGYLYLAQLCAYQKNMRQALFYLQEAAKKKTSPQDLKEIQAVLLSLENYQPTTLREILFKLKAELLVSRIQRMHLGVYALMPEDGPLFLEKARDLQQLYDKYKEVKEKKSYGLQELELTLDEIAEYEHISKEALLVLKARVEDRAKPTPEEGDFLYNYLIAYATPVNKGQEVSLPQTPSTQLLDYFSIFYSKVKDGKLSQKDLEPLFAKISLDYPEELRKAIDIARRTLWTLSVTKTRVKNKNVEIGIFSKSEKSIKEDNHHMYFCRLASEQDPQSFLKKMLNFQGVQNQLDNWEFPGLWKKCFVSDMEAYSSASEDTFIREDDIKNAEITQEEKNLLLKGFGGQKSISHRQLQKNLEDQKIDYVALRKEKQTEERINERIEKIEKRKPIDSQENLCVSKDLEKPDFNTLYTGFFQYAEKKISNLKLPQIKFLDRETLEKASQEYEAEQKERVQLKEIGQLQEKLKNRLSDLNEKNEKIESEKKAILVRARELKRSVPAIRSLLRQAPLLGENRLLESLLDLYQKAEGTGDPELDKQITSFLLLSTENNILLKAQEKIKEHESSKGEEQITIATEIKKLLESSCTYDRYKEREAFIAKKFLVAEYRGGVILRKGQIDTIDLLRKNPNQMTRLRMGLGKTTYILPIIMQILAEEKGKLPIALVPDELFNMNRIDMDRATRRFFEQCAYEFNPNEGIFSDSLLLAQELDRLYEVKESRGYVIARLSQLARIKHNITLCDEALSGSLEKEERIEIEKRRYWLVKMDALLSDEGTQFCGDEADEIFSVNRDINIALRGTEKPINEKVRFAACFLVKRILSSDDKDLGPLKMALMSGQQAALSEKVLRKGLNKLQEIARENYKGNDDQIGIALEKMLFGTLEDVLKQNPDVDFGLQKGTGYSVGPRQEKREKIGEKFSNEYEVSLYNAIQYAAKGPEKAFLLKALPRFYINNKEIFQGWIKDGNISENLGFLELIEKVADYILKPENWEQRLEILEESVFKDELITLTEEEIVTNTHDVIRGKQSGGTSGTGSSYVLPEGFQEQETESQDVEAETFIKLAAKSPNGFDSEVETCPDGQLLHRLKDKISQDGSIRAVINIGLSFDGKGADEIVNKLHELKLEKAFIYINPEDQKPYLKEKDKNPVPFDNKKRVPENTIVFYDSADKRGVDFILPPGTVVYLPGSTTTKEPFCQGVWRARGLGSLHQAVPLLVQSIAKNINEDVQKITLKDLLNHIMQRSDTTQKTLNLKAEMLKIQGVAKLGVEKIYYNPKNSPETNRIFYSVFRGYFVRKRETDFSPPTFGEENVLGKDGFCVNMCSLEIHTLEESKKKLLEEAKKLFEKQAPLFHGVFNHYDNKDNFKITTTGQILFEEFIQGLDEKKEHKKKILENVERIDNKYFSGAYLKIFDALKGVDGLINALDEKKKEYYENGKILKRHKQHLPSTVKKTFSTSSGGTSQQLQQQRQQQKQSSTEIESTSVGGEIKENVGLPIRIEKISADRSFGVSEQALSILIKQKGFQNGVGTFRLLVVKKDEKILLRLITKHDHLDLEDKMNGEHKALIFSLDRTVSDKNPRGITPFKSSGQMAIKDLDNTSLLRISALRFFLGLPISEEEKNTLKKNKDKIFDKNNMKDFLDPEDKYAFLVDRNPEEETSLQKSLEQQLDQLK